LLFRLGTVFDGLNHQLIYFQSKVGHSGHYIRSTRLSRKDCEMVLAFRPDNHLLICLVVVTDHFLSVRNQPLIGWKAATGV